MKVKKISLLLCLAIISSTSFAQQGDPKATEFYSPVPN